MVEKRKEVRDPGEKDQNKAIAKGLTEAPALVPEGSDAVAEAPVVHAGKCPTCGRDLCGER